MEKTTVSVTTAHAMTANVLDPNRQSLTQENVLLSTDVENVSKRDAAVSASAVDGRLHRLFHEHGVGPASINPNNTDREQQSTWSSEKDPADPYNWPSSRKMIIGTIFSFGQLVPIMSASMIAAALGNIAHDLKVDASIAQITLSSYFLGMAFAPFLIAALSEMYGRKRVWVACNAWYILWNALCPVGNSAPLMIVGRFMTGAGASVGVTVSLS